MSVLLDQRPSLPTLRGQFSVFSSNGSSVLCHCPTPPQRACGYCGLSLHPPSCYYSAGVAEVSRFSCMKFPDVLWVLRLRGTAPGLALASRLMLPSTIPKVSASRFSRFRSSIAQPACSWDRTRARQLSGGGLPVSPFQLRDGFTIPPWPRFPRPPDNPGRPVFPGPVRNLGLSSVGLSSLAELKCWFTYAPTSMVCPQPRSTSCVGLLPARCPATALPMEPPSVQSPFAQCRRYRHWGGTYRLLGGRYSPVFAPTDSCANPDWLSPTSASASYEKSLQVATSPLLPSGSSRRYLCESFLRCLVPCRGGPTECTCLFLPPCHRPYPTGV